MIEITLFMFIEMQIGNQLDEDDYLHFDYQSIIIMKKKVFVSDCYDLLHSGLLREQSGAS